ncbi:hypothetical protein BGZ60DRAFT_436540 [Tricladium varicosporioides]|nr:hypothetical protein BGZ60DRAFT_436540 [Hymenoscyphus varicosporioides]
MNAPHSEFYRKNYSEVRLAKYVQISLVGGFGTSKYLHLKLQQWFVSKGIRLKRPAHSQSSVGDTIDSYTKKTFPIWKTFYDDSRDLTSVIHVRNHDRDVAPDTSRHRTVSKMGKVPADFTQVDMNKGISKWSMEKFQAMYKVDYDDNIG